VRRVIKITKPTKAPTILLSRGSRKRTGHCDDYLLHKAEYDAGKRTFAFDAAIYGSETVKNALIKAQHGKCCFCERKTGKDGDVEHFRPKAGYRQAPKGPLLRPGYYWLAYDWDNLLLACSACNQRHKRNLFPLTDPDQRATSHTDDVTRETPLFLQPAQQDPELHIGFRKEIPYAINGSPTGKATIKALGLDRELLNEVRRDRLADLILLRDVVALDATLSTLTEGRQLVQKARDLLAEAVTDVGEFAAMARAAAKDDFHLSLP
jgi:uncharacterized protein (TIGR02646 family)